MKSATKVKAIFAVLALAVLLTPSGVGAQQTYTSLSTWQSAVTGSWLFTTSFQSFTQDTYFQTSAVNAGPFSLLQVGQDPVYGLFQNFIDVPPLQFADNSGVTNAALYTKYGVTTVTLTFSAPVYAWGANFYDAQSSELETMALTDTGDNLIADVPVTVDTGFFGFVVSTSDPVSQITFSSQIDNPNASVGQGFGLDSVTGAYVSGPTTALQSTQVATTASGLAYSRMTQTFNGSVTVTDVGTGSVAGPLQDVLTTLPSTVTLANASGSYQGNPFITFGNLGLAPGQSETATLQFSNPSNSTINASSQVYSGGFN